jgi:hypothetical protein
VHIAGGAVQRPEAEVVTHVRVEPGLEGVTAMGERIAPPDHAALRVDRTPKLGAPAEIDVIAETEAEVESRIPLDHLRLELRRIPARRGHEEASVQHDRVESLADPVARLAQPDFGIPVHDPWSAVERHRHERGHRVRGPGPEIAESQSGPPQRLRQPLRDEVHLVELAGVEPGLRQPHGRRLIGDVVDQDDTTREPEPVLRNDPLQEARCQHLAIGPLEAVDDEVHVHGGVTTPRDSGYALAVGKTLLVSGMAAGFGEAGEAGGLFELRGGEFERIDSLSSTGLCVVDEQLVRALRSTDPGSFAELLIYDARGVRRYIRLDEVLDPHDIAWDPRREAYAIVSSLTNSVHWIATDGRPLSRHVLPGAGDSWHVNSLLREGEQLYASAFGDFRHHREWKSHFGAGRGVIFDLDTGVPVLTGLDCPHHPRLVDGAWVVCDSLTGRLVRADAQTGHVEDVLELAGFTRGIALSGDHALVGESPRTRAGERGSSRATVAIVDMPSWRLVDRIELFACEIYDLVLVDDELAEGARRGFRTNPDRVREQDQLSLFEAAGVAPRRLWAVSEPLAEEDCRVSLRCELPSELGLEETLLLDCLVTNRGGAFLMSAPPYPVYLSYRWRPTGGDGTPDEGEPSRLPRALPPGESAEVTLLLVAPAQPGDYELWLTLRQDGASWFDEVAADNRLQANVTIRPADADAS